MNREVDIASLFGTRPSSEKLALKIGDEVFTGCLESRYSSPLTKPRGTER